MHTRLEELTSFTFRGQNGTCTARREQIKPGNWYWYAYQRTHRQVRKKYLGKSKECTIQRLEEVVLSFRNETMPGDEPSPIKTRLTPKPISMQEQMLAVKLLVPLPPRHLVVRTRLFTRLQKALEIPITLLSAPAGSGKSTVLSSWLRQISSASAWLSLDPTDNDPLRFWQYLLTALYRLYPDLQAYMQPMSGSFSPQRTRLLLTSVINWLTSAASPSEQERDTTLLVLDDYHVITDKTIHQDMAFFLEHLPPQLHLIISTRTELPLPLGRLRVSHRLLELSAADLHFTREEIATFFARHANIMLSPDEITLLEERTSGWAVGLQLVALVLHAQPDSPDILQGIHGSQRSLVEYLSQEILARLPERIQQFLLRTSILKQLNGSLCEAVSDLSDGESTLARLFHENLFLTQLDSSHQWYHYHPVFADALLQHLQQLNASLIPELHRRASSWYRVHGMLAEAVAHAHAAHDWESIAHIVEEVGVELMSRGATRQVMAWVEMLPRTLVFSRLRLFLFECWWRWYAGHSDAVAEMLHEYSQQHKLPALEIEDALQLEEAIRTHVELLYPHPDWSTEQQANRVAEMLALYGILNIQRSDEAKFSQEVCHRAVALVAGLPHRARIVQHLATVYLVSGDLTRAVSVLEDALASALVDESATWVSSIGYRLAMLYEMMGQLHNITRIAQEILQQATGKAFLTQSTAAIFLGNVEYERNNLEAAEAFFTQALVHCAEADILKEIDPYMHLLLGYLQLARIQFIRKDIPGTRQYLEKIKSYLSQNWVGAEVLPVIKGEYALLMHRLEDKNLGDQWLKEFPPFEQNEPMPQRQFISLHQSQHLMSMKILLLEQRWQEAAQFIQNHRTLTEQKSQAGNVIQWLTLRALLYHAQGRTEQAISALTRALSLAEPAGYIRLFLDSRPSLLPLLSQVRHRLQTRSRANEATPSLAYVDRLILLYRQEQYINIQPQGQSPLELSELLSKRELEVLWHLNEGHSNQEIARQLVIAPSTVKSHIRAIYTKLGVESRTQALAHIRKLKGF